MIMDHIRSYVLRQGRVSSAQQRHREDMMPKIGIDYAPRIVDFDALFGRRAPRILEIGFGMGETTAAIAQGMPDHDFIAIEVHTPGVGSLCKQIAEQGIGNIRIVQHDAVEVLRDMIAAGSLAGAHIFFPDPWPKKRHHKRRLIQPPLVGLLASRLAPAATCIARPISRIMRSRWSRFCAAARCWKTPRQRPMALRRVPNIGHRPSSRRAGCASEMVCGTWCFAAGPHKHKPEA